MANWSTSSSWNPSAERGQIRFERFKTQYPKAIFKNSKGETTPIAIHKNYDDVKAALAVTKGSNPFGSGLTISPDGEDEFKTLDKIESNGRAAGTNAATMEIFVACCTLLPINTYQDFLQYMDDAENEAALLKRMQGVTKAELGKILSVVEDDQAYGDHFVKIAKNIHSISHMQNPENYVMMSSAEWRTLKKHGASLFAEKEAIKVEPDKWNPADIMFIKKGVNVEHLLEIKDILELNDAFNALAKAGQIVPISIKKTKSAIKGARGISSELNFNYDNISISQILHDGKGKLKDDHGKSVDILLNYGEGVPDDNIIQRKVLGWIKKMGIDHVEKSAAIAMGTVDLSSCWYVVNDEDVTLNYHKTKFTPKLKAVVVSMVSKAIWLEFKEAFIVARFKGQSNIQLSVESPRENAKLMSYKEVASRKDLTDEQKKFLMLNEAMQKLLENHIDKF